MPTAGSLDRKIRFEQYDDVAQTWMPVADLATVSAQIVANGDGNYEFRIRYRRALATRRDLEPAMRVCFKESESDDDTVVDLTDSVPIGPRRRELRLSGSTRQVPYDNLATGAKRQETWPVSPA